VIIQKGQAISEAFLPMAGLPAPARKYSPNLNGIHDHLIIPHAGGDNHGRMNRESESIETTPPLGTPIHRVFAVLPANTLRNTCA
jgi:hypothetical protein